MLPIPAPALRPQTTAHLAQTMTLLSLSSKELLQRIEAELAKNPALELIEERRCPMCQRRLRTPGPCPQCSAPTSQSPDEAVVFVSTRDDYQIGRASIPDDDLPSIEETSPITEDLPGFVLRQIAPELEPEERPIAAYILNSLDEDGLLPIPLMEIARYHFVPLARVQRVLRKIQFAEPIGVGSPSPEDALLVQLEALSEAMDVPSLAAEAICHGKKYLANHQYAELGKLLAISTRQARQIARFISDNLNPFPARAAWGDVRRVQESTPGTIRQPDVIISYLNGDPNGPLVAEIMLPIVGTLRINPLFRKALSRAPHDKAERWKADLEHANLLVKCLRQRNHTMVRLMRKIVTIQRQFILNGPKYLKPITRAKLARELEVHESTISRAVTNKYAQLPNGRIIPLRTFFDRSLHIRTTLKQLIERETKPLSDTQLAAMLAEEGYQVARRTVAKYRAMEGILPAHLRQKQLNATAS